MVVETPEAATRLMAKAQQEMEAVLRLLKLGLSLEQIAEALELPVNAGKTVAQPEYLTTTAIALDGPPTLS